MAVEKVVLWSKVWMSGKDVRPVMDRQITEFLEVE
jgi:CDP-glucose 4,6-dehydratase